jgi:hypothetical protein
LITRNKHSGYSGKESKVSQSQQTNVNIKDKPNSPVPKEKKISLKDQTFMTIDHTTDSASVHPKHNKEMTS